MPTFAPAIRKNGIADIERVSSKVCPKRVARVLEKKVAKKFGSFKNTPYLCSPIRSQKKMTNEHRTRFFDLLVQLREKCSIYQFLFQRGF